MSSWRRFAIRLTPAMVAFWAAFVVLGTLQPCCEAVADTFLPSYAVPGAHQHEGLQAVHEHLLDGSAPIHTHCGRMLDRQPQLLALSVSASGQGNEAHPGLLPEAIALHHPPVAAVGTPASAPAKAHERSPPLPVYLTTRRLRI